MPIKESTTKIRDYLQNIMTKDMSADQLSKHQEMLKELDNVDKEEISLQEEITSCKDQIVSLVKSQGNANPPQEEKRPRTLEEIASAL